MQSLEEPPCRSSVSVPVRSLLTVWESPLSSTGSPTWGGCGLLDDGHFDRCQVISHCDSYCISLMMNHGEHFHTCLLTTCVSPLEDRLPPSV